MRERRRFNMRPLAWALPKPSKFKCGTFSTMNSSGWSNTSWRLVGIKRNLKSLIVELGRLSTLTKESYWEGLRSSMSFPRPKVPTHEQKRLRRDQSNRKKQTWIFFVLDLPPGQCSPGILRAWDPWCILKI